MCLGGGKLRRDLLRGRASRTDRPEAASVMAGQRKPQRGAAKLCWSDVPAELRDAAETTRFGPAARSMLSIFAARRQMRLARTIRSKRVLLCEALASTWGIGGGPMRAALPEIRNKAGRSARGCGYGNEECCCAEMVAIGRKVRVHIAGVGRESFGDGAADDLRGADGQRLQRHSKSVATVLNRSRKQLGKRLVMDSGKSREPRAEPLCGECDDEEGRDELVGDHTRSVGVECAGPGSENLE